MQRIHILFLIWGIVGLFYTMPIQAAHTLSEVDTLRTMDTLVVADTLYHIDPSMEADTLHTAVGTPKTDTEMVFKDSARLAIEAQTRKAWRRSMIVPGWGQITNGGIWWIKVPAIYGGFVTTGLVFEFNNRYYKSILKDVQYREANNHAIPPDSPYDYIAADSQGTQYLIGAKDYYRRNRDLMVLVTLGWYAVNIVEAYVDSMLKNRWDIGDNYSMQVTPFAAPPTPFVPTTPVFGFNIKINMTQGN